MTGKQSRIAAAACAGLLLAAGAQAADTAQLGTWEKNNAESMNMADPNGHETVVIRRHDSVLDYTWTGIASDGAKATFSYAGPVDGKTKLLPGGDGLKGAMIPTPEGVIESKLWSTDGALEDKFCILSAPTRLTCYATVTAADGKKSIFKEVFDKVAK